MKMKTLFAILLQIIGWTQLSFAGPGIQHIPTQQLPNPLKTMEFEIKLTGTKRFNHPVHLHMIRDGKAINITKERGTLDVNDLPTYSFKALAPKQTLNYYFYFEDEQGTLIQSQRFSINRDCLPDFTQVGIPDMPTHVESQNINEIISQVQRIESENEAYERSIELIKSIKETVEEFKDE